MSKRLSFVVLALALLAPGCRSVAGPDGRSISGIVRYEDGRAAPGARVWADDAGPAYSNSLGQYTIAVSSKAATITVRAQEAPQGGVTAGSYTGRIEVTGFGKMTGRDIVLDTFQPI
jgi:hypothetical protein